MLNYLNKTYRIKRIIIFRLKREINLHGRVDATHYIENVYKYKGHDHGGVTDSVVLLMEKDGGYKGERDNNGHYIVKAVAKNSGVSLETILKVAVVIVGGGITIATAIISYNKTKSQPQIMPKTENPPQTKPQVPLKADTIHFQKNDTI